MIIFFLFALLPPLLSPQFQNFFTTPSQFLNHQCQTWTPKLLEKKAVWRSLVCGNSLPDSELKENLKKHSLIHIFIVSGAHFLFIDQCLLGLKWPFILRLLFLMIYNSMTGFQAPGTRSLLQILFREVLRFKEFHLRSDQSLFFSGLLGLALFPAWANTASYPLSWTAALCLQFAGQFFKNSSLWVKAFFRQALIWFLLLPWMLSFGNGHPAGILGNLILGPWILGVLFPLSVFTVIFPFFSFLFDRALEVFEIGLHWTAEVFPSSQGFSLSLHFFWLYLFFLHGTFHFLELKKHQKMRESENESL